MSDKREPWANVYPDPWPTPAPMTAERLEACKAMYRPADHTWSRQVGGLISDIRQMLDHIDALTARALQQKDTAP